MKLLLKEGREPAVIAEGAGVSSLSLAQERRKYCLNEPTVNSRYLDFGYLE